MSKPAQVFFILILTLFSRSVLASQESILARQIADLAGEYHFDGVECAVVIEDLEKSKVLYSQNADQLLNPASNMKILTTYAALSKLGGDFTFKNQLLGTKESAPGHWETLTLKGSGDPTFSSARLEAMVLELKAKGVRQIDRVMIDDSCFDGSDFPGRFENRQRDAAFNATVGAVAMDHNLLEIHISPGEKNGKPAEVAFFPPLPAFPLETDVTTGGKRSRIIVKNAGLGPEDLTISVKGNIPLKSSIQSYMIAHSHPSELAGLRLIQYLRLQGIQAPERAGISPASSKSVSLVEDLSPPLKQIIQEINKKSNNFMAEQLTQALGALTVGIPGNTQKGVQAIQKQLRGLGIDLGGLHLENGSGLSQQTRLRPRTLIDVLHNAYSDAKLRNDFISSLSVLGVDGTLKRKFHDKDLQGFFAGKTGTMNGVTSLSGYVFRKSAPERPPFLLAFIANGNGKGFWQQKEFQKKLLEILINQ